MSGCSTLQQSKNVFSSLPQAAANPSPPNRPQLSWLSSIANRVTGTALSAGVYAGALAYVAAPAVGLGFDGASIISLFASFPEWSVCIALPSYFLLLGLKAVDLHRAKIFSKTLVGLPFWFHTWNGMRHLGWDMGYCGSFTPIEYSMMC